MKITCKEEIIRYITIDIDQDIIDNLDGDIDCDDIRDIVYSAVDYNGWDEEVCHNVEIVAGDIFES